MVRNRQNSNEATNNLPRRSSYVYQPANATTAPDPNHNLPGRNVLGAPPSHLSSYDGAVPGPSSTFSSAHSNRRHSNNAIINNPATNSIHFGTLKIKTSDIQYNDKAIVPSAGNSSRINIRIKVGNQEHSTSNDDKAAAGNDDDFTFCITTEKELEIEVLQDAGDAMIVGIAKVSILDWMATGSFQGSIDLMTTTKTKTNGEHDNAGAVVMGNVNLTANFHRANTTDNSIATKSYQHDAMIPTHTIGANKNNNSTESDKHKNSPLQFSDAEILEAFRAFDLDKNNFVGAAEIRHVLVSINIGE